MLNLLALLALLAVLVVLALLALLALLVLRVLLALLDAKMFGVLTLASYLHTFIEIYLYASRSTSSHIDSFPASMHSQEAHDDVASLCSDPLKWRQLCFVTSSWPDLQKPELN